MATSTTRTNKPILPRGNDQSPKGYNRAALYSGKALDFDGVNDNVEVPYLDSLANTGVSSTFSFYFNADALTGNMVFAEQRKDSSNRYVVWYDHSNPQIQLYINSSSYRVNFPLTETGRWFYFTGVVDGSTAKMYINGELIGSTSYVPFESNVDFYLGTYNGASGLFYNGKMTNAKIFNTALTAAQVADLYNNPEKVVPTGVADSSLKLYLPMQEGAGTTAYDGSGNGNHGTISGATYVNGIGAPVAQTAVIDWNKGTNLQRYSEDFTQSNWLKEDLSVTANATTAPDGSNTATKIVANTGSSDHTIYDPITNADYVHSLFAKAGEYDYIFLGRNNNFASDGVFFDLVNGTINQNTSTLTATIEAVSGADGWYRCSVIGNMSYNIICLSDDGTSIQFTGDNTSGVYIWGASMISGTTAGSYIPTPSVEQTSEVLLPQGLTTGRDITGVNLFENVRKQGALNLDGNSWAEVHDNESLDVSEITAEGWMYMEDITSLDTNRLVIKWNTSYPERTFQLYATGNSGVWMLSDGSAAYLLGGGTFTQGQWYHIVGTYDGATQRLYVNGSQVNSTALSITLKQSSKEVMIGGYGTGVYSNNDIAQPRIYNRALTAEEVERNYNAGKNIYK
jgi:hypothetical protein